MALILALGFEETSGTTLTDSSGSGNNATLTNGTLVAGGRYGRGLQCSEVGSNNDDAYVPYSASIGSITTEFTLSGWIYTTAINFSWQTLFFKELSGDISFALYVSANDGTVQNGQPTLYVNGQRVAYSTTTLSANTWYYVAATYSTTNGGTIYVGTTSANLTSVGTGSSVGSITAASSDINIGNNPIWTEPELGYIDEVRIYNHELTLSELQTDLDAQIVTPSITVGLTGQSVTATLNDVIVTPSIIVGLTGQSVTATLNDVDVSATTQYSIHTLSETPGNTPADPQRYNFGIKFYVSSDATLKEFRYYRAPGEDFPDKDFYLWDTNSGTVLYFENVTGETASGWQQITLTTPYNLTAGVNYTAGVSTESYFAYDSNYFDSEITNGILTAPVGAGVYIAYPIPIDTIPTTTSNNSTYYVDVVVEGASSGGVTYILGSQSVTATLNDVDVDAGVIVDLVSQSATTALNDVSVIVEATGNVTVDIDGQSISATQNNLDVVDNTTLAPDSRTINIAADARIVFIETALPGTFPPYSNSTVYIYGLRELSTTLNNVNVSIQALPGLIDHWQLDESAGTTATSIGSNANTLTASGSYTWDQTGGRSDGAIELDGSTAYLSIDDAACIGLPGKSNGTGTESFTIAAWVNVDSTGTPGNFRHVIVSKQSLDVTPSRGLILSATEISTGNYPFFVIWSSDSVSTPITSDTMVQPNTWHHVVGTYHYTAAGSSDMALYLDGVLVGSSATATGPLQNNTAPFMVGGYIEDAALNDEEYLDGHIDDVRVYNYALDQTAVTALYNSYPSSITADLTGQSATTTLNDVTATGGVTLLLDAHALSSALNNLSVDIQAGVVIVDLDSQSVSATVGTLSVVTGASFTLTSQLASANIGNITVSFPDLSVPAPDVRTVNIAALDRTITIAAFDRTTTISAQDNTVTIADQGRIIDILLR